MELSQLKYFRHTARTENITRSAAELHISQPALSKMIVTLEKDLGVKLFNREGKHIKLNDHGTVFLKYVEIALGALEDGRKELADVSGRMDGTLNISFDVASQLMPDLLKEFRDRHPEVTFHLLQHARNPTQMKFDFCITSSLVGPSGTEKKRCSRKKFFSLYLRHILLLPKKVSTSPVLRKMDLSL